MKNALVAAVAFLERRNYIEPNWTRK